MFIRTIISLGIVIAAPPILSAQNLSVGVIAGGSLTDAAQDATTSYPGSISTRLWSQSKDWAAGATIEWRFRPNLSVEVDGIYRELHVTWAAVLSNGTLNSVSPSPVVTWEFPVLAKYWFRPGRIRPLVEAGPSFRTTGNLNLYPSHYGATAGLGLETPWHGLDFAPTLRYTRWAREKFGDSFGHLQPNQLELFLRVSHASGSISSPVGRRLSLGAVAGWGVTADLLSNSFPTRTVVAVIQPGGGITYIEAPATQYSTGLRSLVAGPSVEVHFNRHLSAEIDALHKPLRAEIWMVYGDGTRSKSYTTTGAATWQFPVLAKYRVRWGRVDPFLEAGPSFRLPQSDLATHGLTGGAGVETHLRALKIAPAFRFTHWGPHTGFGTSGVARNEASALVGLSFGGPR